MNVVFGLLVLWVICIAVGLIVKTLFWLVVVGVALFAITAVVGALRYRQH